MDTPKFSEEEGKAVLRCLIMLAFCDDENINQILPIEDYLLAVTKEINYINSLSKLIDFENFSLQQFQEEDKNNKDDIGRKSALTLSSLNPDQKAWLIDIVYKLIYIDGNMNQVEFEVSNDIFACMNITQENFPSYVKINTLNNTLTELDSMSNLSSEALIDKKNFIIDAIKIISKMDRIEGVLRGKTITIENLEEPKIIISIDRIEQDLNMVHVIAELGEKKESLIVKRKFVYDVLYDNEMIDAKMQINFDLVFENKTFLILDEDNKPISKIKDGKLNVERIICLKKD